MRSQYINPREGISGSDSSSLPGPKLLYNRNLLYTAVTRAKKCLTIIGSDTTFQEMIRNKSEQERYTSLAERIGEF